MNAARMERLRQRLASLATELGALEAELDKVVAKATGTPTEEQRRACAREAGRLLAQISRVRARLHHGRRLLAHAQGDEYQSPLRGLLVAMLAGTLLSGCPLGYPAPSKASSAEVAARLDSSSNVLETIVARLMWSPGDQHPPWPK